MPRGGETFGAYYYPPAADFAVAWIEKYIRHTEAEWYGRPFKLAAWQNKIVRQIFGWRRKDGTRLIRRVYIEIPRKGGKTEFIAALSLLIMVTDGEYGGQGYFMAVSKEQADKTIFSKICTMAQLDPLLKKNLEVSKTSVYYPDFRYSFRPVSNKASSKHGFSPTFSVADELHQWPSGELADVVRKGMGARRQPLEIMITTAGQPGIGYGWEMHEYAENVLSGVTINPTFLAVIFAADPKDDWRDPKTWAKANPNLGITPKLEYLQETVMAAEGNARLIGDFKRYHLNIWNSETAAGIPMEQWDACPKISVTLESLAGRTVTGALDLSSTTDLTSAVLIAPFADGREGFDVFWKFWMPKEGLADRCRRDRVPYDRWMADGWITGTEGNIVDYKAVRAFLTGKIEHSSHTGPAAASIINISEMPFDRWNATQIVTDLMEDGLNMVQFGQGYGSMSAPSKEFLRLVALKAINHGGNPVARYMAGCTTFITDGAENIKPDKPDRMRSIKRIDGMVTLIMALGRAIVPKEPVPGPAGCIFI